MPLVGRHPLLAHTQAARALAPATPAALAQPAASSPVSLVAAGVAANEGVEPARHLTRMAAETSVATLFDAAATEAGEAASADTCRLRTPPRSKVRRDRPCVERSRTVAPTRMDGRRHPSAPREARTWAATPRVSSALVVRPRAWAWASSAVPLMDHTQEGRSREGGSERRRPAPSLTAFVENG